MKLPIVASLAIGFGLVALLGYFLPIPLLVDLREVLMRWALIVAAVALVVGVANLFTVHLRRINQAESGGFYSAVLVLSLVLTAAVVAWQGPTGEWPLWVFQNIQMPLETSLMAVLAVSLVYAAARLLRRRLNGFTVLFLASALVALLGAAPLLGIEIPGLHGPDGLRALLVSIPAVGGARGLLLGVALGATAAGLRILLGADRPYGG
jgi:hypothetical protein